MSPVPQDMSFMSSAIFCNISICIQDCSRIGFSSLHNQGATTSPFSPLKNIVPFLAILTTHITYQKKRHQRKRRIGMSTVGMLGCNRVILHLKVILFGPLVYSDKLDTAYVKGIHSSEEIVLRI
jgi:hypothetical protein